MGDADHPMPPAMLMDVPDSDILHVSGAGKDIVILNTVEAARELLERRSANYSGR